MGTFGARMPRVKKTPNPTGRTGKPIKLPPTTFEDAVKKALSTPAPATRHAPPTTKKKASKKR